MNNFKMVAGFINGLTKEDISVNTVKKKVVCTESIQYKEHLNNYINTRVEEIDSEYNYRMHRIHTTTSDDVLLTPWVKGGRI